MEYQIVRLPRERHIKRGEIMHCHRMKQNNVCFCIYYEGDVTLGDKAQALKNKKREGNNQTPEIPYDKLNPAHKF